MPPRTVQLRHTLPDGTWHVDWMIDMDPAGESRLATFRLDRRVDELCAGQRMGARRIADHRRSYLSYEGPVSDDRGEVRRLAVGQIEAIQTLGDHWAMLVRWEIASETRPTVKRQRLSVRKCGDDWIVEVLSSPA